MTRPPTRPVAPQVSNSQPACSSTDENRNQGNWICWDASNDKLQMGPNLSIENFVAFYSRLAGGSIYGRSAFRKQICEQSKQRFNNAGIVCVPYERISSNEWYGGCPANAKKAHANFCQYECICITDQYSHIANNNVFPYISNFFSYLPSVLQFANG